MKKTNGRELICLLRIIGMLSVFMTGVGEGFAQEELVIGRKFRFISTVLGEERECWVSLPPDYDASGYLPASYPVIYLLDAERNFHTATGLRNYLSEGPYAFMPRSIVVGIVNTHRSRDLTPPLSGDGPPDATTARFSEGGGADRFLDFFEKELMPRIDSSYRTTRYNLLIGHSLGGLFALHTFFYRAYLFNACVAIDPSLWWDNSALNRRAVSLLKNPVLAKRSLFVASANKVVTPQDTTTDMIRTIGQLGEILAGHTPVELHHAWKFYPDEDHGSIPVPATYDALRSLFKGYQVEVKMAFEEPEIVRRTYNDISGRLGHVFLPAESWLEGLAVAAGSRGRPETARKFYRMATDYYPKSYGAWTRYATVLERQGDKDAALQAFKRADELKN